MPGYKGKFVDKIDAIIIPTDFNPENQIKTSKTKAQYIEYYALCIGHR